ncbi:acetoin dehydrogenase-like protein [Podospora didyma]|uniref:Acetoin dehydrogenase-like protein n=1 Tax=Podospora didyma TaxID=330526 RepID=A0AAE0N4M1_9PEZI|nr:acetoin dehydrogenase-like protein [Podospora didyma]
MLRQRSLLGPLRTSRAPLSVLPPQTPPHRAFSSSPDSVQQKRTAIVTGGARGIGRAIALRLAHDGYDVTVNDLASAEALLHDTVVEIEALGRKGYAYVADVTSEDEVKALVRASVDKLGPLSTMVANAGICQAKGVFDITPADFKRVLDVNLFGVQYCYQAAARQMVEQKTPGKLIGAASVAGYVPYPLFAPYSTSKWAVRGLTHAYALELGGYNITANAYAPGVVLTDLWERLEMDLVKLAGGKKGQMMEKLTSERVALGRAAKPEDVANLVSFLASKDADYVTGKTFMVDGGLIYN